jgi:hypothetical protein
MRENGGGCVSTPSISYVGTYTPPNTSCTGTPPTASASVPVEDPLAGRYSIPTYTGCDHTNFSINNGAAQTIYPGVYCGGINISGGSTGAVTFDNGAPRSQGGLPGTGFAASAPNGSYILVGGGLRISGVPVTGTGVTFFDTYNSAYGEPTYSQINITGGTAAINLTAPTSGTNKALLFYQDPTVAWAANNGSSITGSSTSQFQGIFYFPTTDLTFIGNSTTSGLTGNTVGAGYTILIGYNIKVNGGATINNDYSSLGGGTDPLLIARFTE